MVSEQFQSSFRAVSEQFSYDFLMENLAIQNPDSTLSQVENKGPDWNDWWMTLVDVLDALRTPERRLIRESRSHPITLLKSGRFSSHWFIILTDVLVHVGYSTHVTYPLNTIWVEPLQDCEANQSKVSKRPYNWIESIRIEFKSFWDEKNRL